MIDGFVALVLIWKNWGVLNKKKTCEILWEAALFDGSEPNPLKIDNFLSTPIRHHPKTRNTSDKIEDQENMLPDKCAFSSHPNPAQKTPNKYEIVSEILCIINFQ